MKTKRLFLMAGMLACTALYSHAASAGETYTSREVTTTEDGVIVDRTTTTSYKEPMVVAPTSSTVTTTTVTQDTYYLSNGADDEQYFPPNSRRIGQTYAWGEDDQGNNTLRYENRTHDGYNN